MPESEIVLPATLLSQERQQTEKLAKISDFVPLPGRAGFFGRDHAAVQKILRLHRDLGIHCSGTGLVPELLERMEVLETKGF